VRRREGGREGEVIPRVGEHGGKVCVYEVVSLLATVPVTLVLVYASRFQAEPLQARAARRQRR